MKKLYSLLTLAAATLTATAATPTESTAQISLAKPAKVATIQKVDLTAAKSMKQAKKHAPETKEATSVMDYEGEYLWDFSPLLSNMSSPFEITITVTDEATGAVEITGITAAFLNYPPIKGTIDMTAGTLTIPNGQYLGEYDEGYPDYFYIKSIDWDAGEIVDGKADVEATVGVIDGTNIVFTDDDVWAVGNPDDEEAGWWDLSYMNEFDKVEFVDPMDGWEVYCTGKMQDGWIYPAYGIDPVGNEFEVEIHKSTTTAGLYRVFNPYLSEGFAGNELATEGAIVFDITDPEFVMVIPGVKSGMANGTEPINCLNFEGYYISAGNTKEEIVEFLTTNEIGVSTYKDNVVTIPDARIGISGKGCYSWSDNGTSLANLMVATITFDKTPAEYVSVTAISFAEEEVTLKEGSTTTLNVVYEPEDITGVEFTWTSTNEEVATVSATGEVTAVAPGEATIVASIGELTAECKVIVYAKSVLTFGLIVPIDQTVTLACTIDNPVQTDEAVTWTSSDTAVATVSEGGTITGVAVGTVDITATYDGESTSITVTVVEEQNDLINEITAAKVAKKYDLQGRSATNSTKGVVIVSQGKKAEKVIVK